MQTTAIFFLLVIHAADEQQADQIKIAKLLVQQMSEGKHESAIKPFDKVMQQGLPASKLKQVWDGLTKVHGRFKIATKTRVKTSGKYQIVFVLTEFERGSLETKVVFSGDNQIVGLFFVPAGQYKSPSYVDPAKFDEDNVTVGKGLWSLPGTLSLPNGDGPFPAIVLVHGSGANDRDETVGPNKPFRDLAHGLATRGIAVLRYEKRTKHHRLTSALLASTMTVKEETVDDAAAAVETARKHKCIDESRVFVLGHSLGGNLIPRIADANDATAGFISLAGSTRPLEDLILEQTRYLAALDGKITDEESKSIKTIEQQVALVKSKNLSAKTPTSKLPLGVPVNYWLDLRDYDPAASAKEIDKPMLILQGMRDYQVTIDDFNGWKRALNARDNVQFITYPKLNHLFMAGEGKSSPSEYMTAGNVAKVVIDDIATFVAQAGN